MGGGGGGGGRGGELGGLRMAGTDIQMPLRFSDFLRIAIGFQLECKMKGWITL